MNTRICVNLCKSASHKKQATQLLIMRPHAQDMNHAPLYINGIDDPVLDIDSAGIEPF